MRAVRAAIAAAVMMTSASCGGDDAAVVTAGTAMEAGTLGDGTGRDEQSYADAFAESLRQDGDDLEITAGQADCIGTRFADLLGVARLQDAGVSPADVASGDELDFSELGLDEDDSNEVYDVFGACDVNLRDNIVEAMGSDGSMTDDVRKCLEDRITDDVVREFFTTAMVQGDAGSSATSPSLSDVLMSCLGSAMETVPSSDG